MTYELWNMTYTKRAHWVSRNLSPIFAMYGRNFTNISYMRSRDVPNMPLIMFGRSRIFRRTGRTSTEVLPNFGRIFIFYDEWRSSPNLPEWNDAVVSECWLLRWVDESRVKTEETSRNQHIKYNRDIGHWTMDMGQPASFKSLEVWTLEFGTVVYCLHLHSSRSKSNE